MWQEQVTIFCVDGQFLSPLPCVCATPACCGYLWMGVTLPVAESCSQYVPVPLEGLQMWLFHSWGIICTLNTPKADELIIIFYLSHL